jgi:hypothetical protein
VLNFATGENRKSKGRMEAALEKVYLRQIDVQCRYALTAVARMNAILAIDENMPIEDFFREAQALLNCAGAVSRLLWPPRIADTIKNTRAVARGEYLRTALAISEPNALQDRGLRNHLEHFDERLDDWAENSRNRNIADRLIGPRGMIGGGGIADTDIFRQFDPATKKFIFRGDEFDLEALVSAILDVAQRIQARNTQLEDRRRD